MSILTYLWSRKTTVFGYVQVFLAVLATTDGVFPTSWLKFIILANGLVTAGIGHYNNSQLKKAATNSTGT
jgi:hypothetical protein